MYGFNKVPVLSKGDHASPEEGMCMMELVCFINREPFSDSPLCTDERISAYMQYVNDTVTDEERVKLLSVLDRMFHTGDMTWDKRVDANVGLQSIWPQLGALLETNLMKSHYENAPVHVDSELPSIYLVWDTLWDTLYTFASSSESVDVKLAVLNKVLDVMDKAMGVEETLPQNRAEIEKMLARLKESAAAASACGPWVE